MPVTKNPIGFMAKMNSWFYLPQHPSLASLKLLRPRVQASVKPVSMNLRLSRNTKPLLAQEFVLLIMANRMHLLSCCFVRCRKA